MPTVNVEAFEVALEEFAKFAGAGPDHQVLLVLDGAGWHTSKRLRVPAHVHLHFLPPYSPQLQPAERLWPLLHEAIANKPIEDIDQLEAILIERCNALDEDKPAIQHLTEFHWWREAVHPIL